MQYSPLLQNGDGDLSQNTGLLVPDVPMMRTQWRGWLAFNKSHPSPFGHLGRKKRQQTYSKAILLWCPLGQMFLHHHYFHDKGICRGAVAEWTTQAKRTCSLYNIMQMFMYFWILSLCSFATATFAQLCAFSISWVKRGNLSIIIQRIWFESKM